MRAVSNPSGHRHYVHVDHLAYLLRHKVDDPYQKDFAGNTVLHKAATNGLLEHLKVLLEYGTLAKQHIKAENVYDETPLEVAMKRFLDSVQATKDQADKNANNKIRWKDLDCVTELIKYGADPNDVTFTFYGETLIHAYVPHILETNLKHCAQSPTTDRRVLRKLIEFNTDINKGSDRGGTKIDTPLLRACRGGHIKLVQLLIEMGADLKKSPHCLHVAAKFGKLSTVRLLLSEGADPNFNHKGMTDLHRLCKPRKYPFF